jgi:hypothetical protein
MEHNIENCLITANMVASELKRLLPDEIPPFKVRFVDDPGYDYRYHDMVMFISNKDFYLPVEIEKDDLRLSLDHFYSRHISCIAHSIIWNYYQNHRPGTTLVAKGPKTGEPDTGLETLNQMFKDALSEDKNGN